MRIADRRRGAARLLTLASRGLQRPVGQLAFGAHARDLVLKGGGAAFQLFFRALPRVGRFFDPGRQLLDRSQSRLQGGLFDPDGFRQAVDLIDERFPDTFRAGDAFIGGGDIVFQRARAFSRPSIWMPFSSSRRSAARNSSTFSRNCPRV